MKINELFESKHDEWDEDDVPSVPSDPDSDKIPHILMQMKKAIDVQGNYPITFKDGTKTKIPLSDIVKFVEKYVTLKPMDREKMQDVAGQSKENFDMILKHFRGETAPKSIYQ